MGQNMSRRNRAPGGARGATRQVTVETTRIPAVATTIPAATSIAQPMPVTSFSQPSYALTPSVSYSTAPSYLGQYTSYSQPLTTSFTQQPLSSSFAQQPLSSSFAQQPLSSSFTQQPMSSSFTQPLSSSFAQQPLSSSFNQPATTWSQPSSSWQQQPATQQSQTNQPDTARSALAKVAPLAQAIKQAKQKRQQKQQQRQPKPSGGMPGTPAEVHFHLRSPNAGLSGYVSPKQQGQGAWMPTEFEITAKLPRSQAFGPQLAQPQLLTTGAYQTPLLTSGPQVGSIAGTGLAQLGSTSSVAYTPVPSSAYLAVPTAPATAMTA